MRRLVSFVTSVRLRLLLLALLPLVVSLPLLLAVVIYWGLSAYDRLLIYKINAELVIAQQYLERVLDAHRLVLESGARSASLAAAREDAAALRGYLKRLATEAQLDFLHLLDAQGRLIASSSAKAPGDRHAHWPVVAAAGEGRSEVRLDVFSATELEELDPELRRRAYFAIVPTRNAATDEKKEESRGMLIHGAAPVLDRRGQVVAVLEGGLLLNRNLAFVDKINDIVYTERALPLGSRGTATLFLDDVRIATNVRMFEAAAPAAPGAGNTPRAGAAERGSSRALGTRVSLAVRDKVLGEGKTWLDRAFVVNDWYVSGYQPLHDSFGRRIGMLYVGYLEAPFAQVKRDILLAVVGLFLLITLAVSIVGLRWARGIFRPLERMDATMRALERGEAAARVGEVRGEDEIARLARQFDGLLDTLRSRSQELEQLNAQLDQKVVERTRELAQANDDLRRAQEHLVRSEKLAAIGQLTAGVAHEINNPIAVMQGNLDLMRDVLGAAAAPVGKEMRLLDEQINRIRVIVAKLLQFARPDEFAGFVEALDVNAVVGDCLVLVRHELKKARVEVVQELRASRRVTINRNELQQVLINLMVNALHAMAQGGTLTLVTEDGQEPGVRIRVRDTGGGIEPQNIHRIFDPFYTTKKTQGTGLGLSVSLALVEHYGGTIGVESVPGQGSEFSIWLPCEPRHREDAKLATVIAAAQPNRHD